MKAILSVQLQSLIQLILPGQGTDALWNIASKIVIHKYTSNIHLLYDYDELLCDLYDVFLGKFLCFRFSVYNLQAINICF